MLQSRWHCLSLNCTKYYGQLKMNEYKTSQCYKNIYSKDQQKCPLITATRKIPTVLQPIHTIFLLKKAVQETQKS